MIAIEEIIEMLPHRYPFLLIDRVTDVKVGEAATSLKNVSINEHFFQGHFPKKAVFPGVLIVEAMAQTSAVLVVSTLGDEAKGKLVYFMSVDNVRFRKPVVPGDQLVITATVSQNRKNVWKFSCVAEVDGEKVAEANIAAMIMDEPGA